MNVRDKTFKYERLRAVSAGIIETTGTFLLLLAVQVFAADPTSKALIAAGGSFGLMLGPLVVSYVERNRIRISHAASILCLIGAASFLVASTIHHFPVFLACSIIGSACGAATVPLVIQMYQENYAEEERGRMFSNAFMIRIAATIIFSQIAGFFLSKDIQRYPWLLATFAISYVFSSFCISRCPSKPLTKSEATHPLKSLRFIREDRLFRWTLICWMLLGFANLMIVPLRIEYLANSRFGFSYDPATIAFLLGVVPNLARFAVSGLWGRLFDRVNFFGLRMTLNFGFMLGTLTFFFGDSFESFLLGAIIFGISNAGGDVAWSLWVTKIAPTDRVADYMAVHTLMTGIRGVLAPLFSFHLLAFVSLQTIGWINAGMIILATLMLLPELKSGRKMRAVPVIKEFSE
jgi:MFS family permease